MLTDLEQTLKSLHTVVVTRAKITDNVFASKFEYIFGSFEEFASRNLVCFNDLFEGIDSQAEVSQGFGYKEYCEEIRNTILACVKDKKKYSFIVPLMNDYNYGNFLMVVSSDDSYINVMFARLESANVFFNVDDFVSSTFKDKLTGLFNFKTLQDHLSKNNRDGYLVLFDLNKFKVVNDNYGHEVGDIVLDLISSYIISISSSNEIFYRRSGDEFMILVLKHDYSYVQDLIYKINNDIIMEDKKLREKYPHIDCSAAFGVVELVYGKTRIDDDLLIKLTDLAMYQAKKSGNVIHHISHLDALSIIKAGDLDERLASLVKH